MTAGDVAARTTPARSVMVPRVAAMGTLRVSCLEAVAAYAGASRPWICTRRPAQTEATMPSTNNITFSRSVELARGMRHSVRLPWSRRIRAPAGGRAGRRVLAVVRFLAVVRVLAARVSFRCRWASAGREVARRRCSVGFLRRCCSLIQRFPGSVAGWSGCGTAVCGADCSCCPVCCEARAACSAARRRSSSSRASVMRWR